MRRVARVLALCSSVLFSVAIAAAGQAVAPQQPHPFPDSAGDISFALSKDQDQELTSWLEAMKKWQRYQARWNNRPARDGLGRIASRKPVPDPPQWLGAYCERAAEAHVDLEPDETIACRLVVDPRASFDAVPGALQTARADEELPPRHTSFLTRVHIDGLWTTASSNNRFYGLVGSHVSLVDVGRLQVFGPPGVLLVSLPDADGSRRITLGYTWGLSVRLSDVRLFGPTRDMTLFLNVSKVWIAGSSGAQGTSRGYDMMGLSIAPRKKR
jgi:hypothetical protein